MHEWQTALRDLWEKMRFHCERADAPEYEAFFEYIPKLTERSAHQLHKRVKKFYDSAYTEAARIFTEPGATPEFWDNLELVFDKPELKEHKILDSQYRKICKRIPDFVRQIKNGADATAKKKSTRSKASKGVDNIS